MESLLEQQRRYHEERERLTDALVQVRNIVEGLSFYINLIVGNFLKNYFWTLPPGVPSPPAPPPPINFVLRAHGGSAFELQYHTWYHVQ